MYRIFAHLNDEHHHGLLAMAIVTCVLGSVLTVLLLRRMIEASGDRTWFLCALASVIGGTTIWSTHFVAMLAYDPSLPHSYAFAQTVLSLAFATGGVFVSNAMLALKSLRWRATFAGITFGLTVSGMHYLGMAAYQIPGMHVWDAERVVASVWAGTVLGALAYHRIMHPVTRLCWLGGALGLILSIAAMHFTGMTAFSISPDPTIAVPEKAITDLTFGILVGSVTATLFLVGFVSYNIDVNLERESNGRMQHAAMHDYLTGLPNRLKLSRVLSDIAERLAVDPTYKAAVLSIDLNLFKQVNDLHGHAVGDAALCEIAHRLSHVIDEGEFIARTGGDEFVAIKQAFRRKSEVATLAHRINTVISEPLDVAEAVIELGASIGIATTLSDGRDIEALLPKADQAMYRAKADPSGFYCFFNEDIDRQSQEKAIMVQDLRSALPHGEFELVYQRQNTLSTLEAVGFESLLRWNHPIRGRVPPSEFIPLAEETGLIREIGAWVLRTACQRAAEWPHPYNIAVNVAPQQLIQPSFTEQVAEILRDTGLAADRLELEITEASMIDDPCHTLRVMHALKDMGVRIAMDDFGTGYSSLATLQAFPFDKIKIDRSFITDVHQNTQRAAIVRSTLLLGDALGIPVLAEGVEKQQELAFLTQEKCNAVQGFYFGLPMSLAEVDVLMQTLQDACVPEVG